MHAALTAIEYYLPEAANTTESLAAEFPEWQVAKIDSRTGIRERHIAAPDECSSDLAVTAAQKLFASGVCRASEIDYVLLCTQTPDYLLPTTACLVQDRIGISSSAGALDFNLGSSGYIYGLGLAEGLIATAQANRVLLLTADTYTKFLHPQDKSVRTIFGDAATATLLSAIDSPHPVIGPFVYGTDGKGAPNLIIPAGGVRRPRSPETAIATEDGSGNVRSSDNLFMDGAEIFNFTLTAAPDCLSRLLAKSGLTMDQIDRFVFHQANRYMLEHLRKRLQIPAEKFEISLAHSGNTVSSTIPIALKDAQLGERLRPGMLVMLVGFGVGYSWGATLVRLTEP
jgi:3-oxoacyl-[acyl-carrier-protein] synthase III